MKDNEKTEDGRQAADDSARRDTGPGDGWKPDVDVPNRILRNAVFGTTGLATDGRIILPSGMDIADYMKNPIVTRRHTIDPDGLPVEEKEPLTVARTLKAHTDDFEVRGDEVQFADTELGRQFAYLYGVNEKREAYMRGWSIEARRRESYNATFDQARRIASAYWHEAVAEPIARLQKQIPVWTKSVLRAVALAPLGADRDALTRAFSAGVPLAGEIIARLDLGAARGEISNLKLEISDCKGRIERMERQIQALGRDGASAAARGDSEALLREIQSLRELVRKQSRQ